MLWLLPVAASAGVLWWMNRQKAAAPPVRFLSAAEGRSAYALPPYAGDVDQSSVFATGLPTSGHLLPQYAMAANFMETPSYAAPASYVPPTYSTEPSSPSSLGAYVTQEAPGFMPSFAGDFGAPSPSLPQPIAYLRCAADRCWVRPEPRPWDDATMGRFGFTAPRGYIVGVLSFGPIGWAHVVVQHPDDGMVDGFVELRFLENVTEVSRTPASPSTPQDANAQPITTDGASPAAMHQAFMEQKMQGARTATGSVSNRFQRPMPSTPIQGRATPRMRRQQQRAGRKAA